jgi:hypothetical protein
MATMIRVTYMLIFFICDETVKFCLEHPGGALLIFAILFGGGACLWSLCDKLKEMRKKEKHQGK